MIRTKTHRRGRPITREQRALIREQARQGKSGKEIEAYMSCSKRTVRRAIVNNFKDNLDEDAEYLLGTKGGLVFINDDVITPEPQRNMAEVKEEYENADILSISDWSPTPIDPNDLPYIGSVHEEADQAKDNADKDRPVVLRQSARLRGLKVQDHGAESSSSSSSSRTAVAPALASHNLNNENAPVPARGQTQVSNNKTLSRDAAIKILRDLGLDETHADIVIATGIKSAEHLKGMADFPDKLLHFIKTDVSEQGFSNWDYFELLYALWQRRDSGWRET
ncbi:hypothetical protein EWM64_g8593 [Hericium alpestre]|uniref:Uncharacterized protein n=1 Tax=Hericium alpestre TaxID=135208 RepID=A0A4Y9ZPQ9_9AGAM|nr:hypothetical protein EWM64_g8593 [Hericium alpestre]